MPIAKHMRKYFWDINPAKAHPKSHPAYYMRRILEFGDRNAFFWLQKVFGMQKIHLFVKKSRLSPKSKRYWKLVLQKQ